MQNLEQFDNFKLDILNEQFCDSLTAYIFTAKVGGRGGAHERSFAHKKYSEHLGVGLQSPVFVLIPDKWSSALPEGSRK